MRFEDFLSVFFSLVVQLKIRLKLDLFDFLGRLVEQVSPPHLLRDDLVTIRVVDVFLEQFHIAFCLAILLLEKSFPIVFIPSTLWLIVEISHTPFFYLRLPEPANFLSRDSGIHPAVAKSAEKGLLARL